MTNLLNTFNPSAVSAVAVVALFGEVDGIINRAASVISKAVRLEHDAVKTPEQRADFIRDMMRECNTLLNPSARWDAIQKQIKRVAAAAGYALPKMNRRTVSCPIEWAMVPVSAAPLVSPIAPDVVDTKGRTATATVDPTKAPIETGAETLARDLLAALQSGDKLPAELVAELVAALHTAVAVADIAPAELEIALVG